VLLRTIADEAKAPRDWFKSSDIMAERAICDGSRRFAIEQKRASRKKRITKAIVTARGPCNVAGMKTAPE